MSGDVLLRVIDCAHVHFLIFFLYTVCFSGAELATALGPETTTLDSFDYY